MIDRNNPEVVVPSIPSPRKNKYIIKGRITFADILIVIGSILLVVILVLIVGMKNIGGYGGLIGIIIGIALVDAAFVWPLGFLGKEKFYIFLYRLIRFVIQKQKLKSEEWKTINSKDIVSDRKMKSIQDEAKRQEELKNRTLREKITGLDLDGV
ncbi:MAG: hypothetical protein LBT17_01030 [Mycoplasmataceae bacterium]|jgi:hypothetical protein|nr:hypothetical protein [Mycoplasmataceae bacterium]